MICLRCAEYRPGSAGSRCDTCLEELVSEKRANLERLFEARTRLLLTRWQRAGLLPTDTAALLAADLASAVQEHAEASAHGASHAGHEARLPAAAPPAVAAAVAAVATEAPVGAGAAPIAVAVAIEIPAGAGAAPIAEGEAPRFSIAVAAVAIETLAAESAVQEPDEPDEDDAADDLEDAAAAASDLIESEAHAGALGGLGSFVALDAPGLVGAARRSTAEPGRWQVEVVPLLHEYVWWFIGTVLVLAGSIMGVREGWRTLAAVPRQVLISCAFFGYHAGFVGLSALLSRRSPTAGRVLGAVGIGLLPVVFVALAALVDLDPRVGVAVAVPLAAAAALTLRWTGARFDSEAPRSDREAPRSIDAASARWLPAALLPALLAELPLSSLRMDSWLRAALPFAGVGAVAFARRLRAGPGAPAAPLAFALYGALALLLFGLLGAPDNSVGFAAALTPGTVPAAGLLLWAVVLGAVLLGGRGRAEEARGEASPGEGGRGQGRRRGGTGAAVEEPAHAYAIEVLLLACVACAALGATSAGFSVLASADARVIAVSLATLALATALFVRAEQRHPAALHPAILGATVTTAVLARLVVPGQVPFYCFGAAVAPALGLLASGALAGARRARLLRWCVALCALALPTTWLAELAFSPGATRLWAALATAALVASAAHVAGGVRARGLHYLGGAAGLCLALVWFLPRSVNGPATAAAVLCGAGWAFALCGLIYEEVARRAAGQHQQAQPQEPLTGARAGRFARRLQAAAGPWPFDDLSLIVGAVAALVLIGRLPLPAAFVLGGAFSLPEPLWQAYRLAALAGLLLLLRALRDRSRLVGFAGAYALAACALAASGATSTAQLGLAEAGLALACALGAAARLADPVSAAARPLFGALTLPLGSRGGALLTDGLAASAALLSSQAALNLLAWVQGRVEPQRPLAVLGGALLILVMLVGFLTRAAAALRLRGSLLLLSLAGVCVALTAVLNRIGRPLPPAVIGLRLTLMLPAVWLVALAARRYGPALGALLDNDRDGPRYHLVPHAGVLALALVLFVDALLLGAPDVSRALLFVPPLMPLGAALGVGLLCRSARWLRGLHLALLLCVPGAALWAVQGHLVGPELLQVTAQRGVWARLGTLAAAGASDWLSPAGYLRAGETVAGLWAQAVVGVSALAVVLALAAVVLLHTGATQWIVRLCLDRAEVEGDAPALLRMLRRWAGAACAIALGAAWLQPVLLSAGLVTLCGVVLLFGGGRRERAAVLLAGAAMLIHAAAHRFAVVPVFPGPALAALAVALVGAAWQLRARRSVREPAHLLALIFFGGALIYAFATGGATSATAAGPRLLDAAAGGLAGRWVGSFALALTLLLGAVGFAAAAPQWRGPLCSGAALWAVLLGGGAADAALAAWGVRAGWLPPLLLLGISGARHLWLLSAALGARLLCCTALAAVVAHGVGLLLAALEREPARGPARGLARGAARGSAGGPALKLEVPPESADLLRGVRLGRDWLLIVVGLLTCLFVTQPAGAAAGGGLYALQLSIAGLLLGLVVSVHAAAQQRSGLHVYFVQSGVVAVYALVRALRGAGVPPEADALFILVLGFVLTGVTVWARRGGIPAVHRAVRRFASVLPVGIALILPAQMTHTAAVFSAGSSVLYLALATVERSRAIGALGALAANLALLITALSSDLRGVEIYLAPLGLLVLMLGQIFAQSLPAASRRLLQVVGGLLFYAPAAVKLSAQLGDAASGLYSVVFGGACLLGVAVGMLLHIRAYLFLGTGFLVLDVAANLINAGLRDRRVGFWVLSLSGLAILGAMVVSTLKGEEVRRLVDRLRRQLRSWD